MAFIKLFPHEGLSFLDIGEVISRLQVEFGTVEVDAEAGRDHVGDMIAATLRFSDSLPGKQERLEYLQAAQPKSVLVVFGDSNDAEASCCLMPEFELFFGCPDEVDGPARPLVERAAAALDYELFEG